jgi:hypothetical protein
MRPDPNAIAVPPGQAHSAPLLWALLVVMIANADGSCSASSLHAGDAPIVTVAVPGGFYDESVWVPMESEPPTASIRYTLDGSEPTDTSAVYSSPLLVTQTTVLRSRAYAPDVAPGPTVTHNYFVDQRHTVAVVSLVTHPDNLWSEETGIYVMGAGAEPEYPHYGANFWQDWERPVHIELYEPAGQLAFSIDAGMKIHGDRGTRAQPQKSLSLFARARYGYGSIKYQVFPDLALDRFEALVLRTSGNDWNASKFRDALMTSLGHEIGQDVQAYRPAVVYLNGAYWGIQNIREKLNEHYLASHHGTRTDEVDILEGNASVVTGSATHYEAAMALLARSDMSDESAYRAIQSLLDVDNLIDYQIAQIYFGNTDWPGSNVKYWRPRTADGRWRWLLYDTDFGFGRWVDCTYSHNTLAFASAPDGPGWPNPPWSTFLLRKLLENDELRGEFVDRFADLMNTTFRPVHVADRILEMEAALRAEMPAHLARWELANGQWRSQVNVLNEFAENRADYVRQHLRDRFGLGTASEITVEAEPAGGGTVSVNSLLVTEFPWTGTYFADHPVRLSAISRPGYRFARWVTSLPEDQPTPTLCLSEAAQVRAIFAEGCAPAPAVVITEINYHSARDFDPADWVELYNSDLVPVDLSGWILTDSDPGHEYRFREGTALGAGQYLVVCRDLEAFGYLFPGVPNAVGDLGFGLSSDGDHVRLLDRSRVVVDSVVYADRAPWPSEPDGNGPTLALVHPGLDNALPQSWRASAGSGTPGIPNSGMVPPLESPLRQNFPNPFGRRTVIPFVLAESTQVVMEVYDCLGQRVATTLSTSLPAGHHAVVFDGSHLAAGVYVCRIATDHLVAARKMVLAR